MAYSFKAICTSNKQAANGTHVAKLSGEAGQELADIFSADMTFVPGSVYTISVDGKFALKPEPKLDKPAPPVPAHFAGPERRVHQVPIPLPGLERRHTIHATTA
jgi:hypothetical protein